MIEPSTCRGETVEERGHCLPGGGAVVAVAGGARHVPAHHRLQPQRGVLEIILLQSLVLDKLIETLYSLILLEVILDLVQLQLSKEILICIFLTFSCYPKLVSFEHLPEVLVLVAGAGGGEVRDAGHGVVILVALPASRLESCIMRGHVIIIIYILHSLRPSWLACTCLPRSHSAGTSVSSAASLEDYAMK